MDGGNGADCNQSNLIKMNYWQYQMPNGCESIQILNCIPRYPINVVYVQCLTLPFVIFAAVVQVVCAGEGYALVD